MLKVVVMRVGDTTSVTLVGHACAGEYGSDIVCASASMLAYTLAEAVNKRVELGMFACIPTVDITPGDTQIIFKAHKDHADELGTIVDVIADGYRMLAASYPDNVEFIYDATPERV